MIELPDPAEAERRMIAGFRNEPEPAAAEGATGEAAVTCPRCGHSFVPSDARRVTEQD